MLVAGIMEGSFALNKFDPKNYHRVRLKMALKKNWMIYPVRDGETAIRGRAALFLKGKVRGDYLLTLAYDSSKENNQRLFRDIRQMNITRVWWCIGKRVWCAVHQ